MLKNLFVIVACIVICGCAIPVPGKLEVQKGSIQAQGNVATAEKGGALIRTMQIDLTKMPPTFLEDIWVEIRVVGKTTLAKVTPQLLKEQGVNETSIDPPREAVTVRYRDGGFSFDFDRDGKLITVEADTGSSDETSTENPRMGTTSTGNSLKLPCSVPEFEMVFGKPDKIRFSRANRKD